MSWYCIFISSSKLSLFLGMMSKSDLSLLLGMMSKSDFLLFVNFNVGGYFIVPDFTIDLCYSFIFLNSAL